MANKKKIEARLEAERQARQRRYIQIAGAVIIVLLVALVIWQSLPKNSSQQTTAVDIGDQPASDIFSDIPVAAQYTEPPLKIDTTKQYFATVKMAKGGEFVI